MNIAIKFIVFAVLVAIFLYLTITSVQRLIQADEERKQAEKEYDNTIKYGCPNPIVSTGGVIC
jgi:hypothetical protein